MRAQNRNIHTSNATSPSAITKLCAFTLAEVLITLAISGVVAALTIPTVVRNYTEKQTVVQLKKVYSQLNSAFQMAQVNNGAADTWDWGSWGDGEAANNIVQTYFVPYLKILKNCGAGDGCWANVTYTNLKGNTDWGSAYLPPTRASKLLLADGTSLAFWTTSSKCNQTISIQNIKPLNRVCGVVHVDINGDKGPARSGRDVFSFRITKYGIYPYGLSDNFYWGNLKKYCNYNADYIDSGHACTAWILQHENMDYLRKTFTCTGGGEVGSGTPYDCKLED